MINELFNLSTALDSVQTQTQNWHRKYKPIPNIRKDAPCVRITVSSGKVICISRINTDLGRNLRKYGSNQGSYPCMNLAPLYRVTDESVKKELTDIGKHPEKIDDVCICKMKAWCTESNWTKKFLGKYKVSMEKTPIELSQAANQYPKLQTLLNETESFVSASALHTELERAAWDMLERKPANKKSSPKRSMIEKKQVNKGKSKVRTPNRPPPRRRSKRNGRTADTLRQGRAAAPCLRHP